MNIEQAKKLVLDLYHDIWQSNNLGNLSTYYHPEFTGLADEQPLNYQDMEHLAHYQKQHYQDLKFEFHEIISYENRIAFRFNSSGKKDGQLIRYHTMGFYHLQDNKVHKLWALTQPYFNFKP